jgi:hypothetical protein
VTRLMSYPVVGWNASRPRMTRAVALSLDISY